MSINLKNNKTKILITLGPASSDPKMIERLIRLGVRGFRHNFSHGKNEERLEEFKWIRTAAKKLGVNVAIVQDLQGPKIRLGKLVDNHYDVKAGDEITLTYGIEHDGGPNLPIQHDISKNVKPGEKLTLADGTINAEIVRVIGKTVHVKIKNKSYLMSNKGVNLPDTDFGGDIFTEKDLKDIAWGAGQDYDYVAMSFVQRASDIEKLRRILKARKSEMKIIAKIETKSATAWSNLEEIVAVSDGVMVARNDMSADIGVEKVPVVQQEILGLCERYGKFSIVASQMLTSMMENPNPTRAEVSDIAYAAMSGADVVMLSDETTNGKYPVEAAAVMQKTIAYTQDAMSPRRVTDPLRVVDARRDHLAIEAVDLMHAEEADAIVVETRSGRTAQSVSLQRPEKPIIVVTNEQRVANQTEMLFGVQSVVVKDSKVDYGLRYMQGANFHHKKAVVVSATESERADTVRVVEIR
jgi:pyruvate kinase